MIASRLVRYLLVATATAMLLAAGCGDDDDGREGNSGGGGAPAARDGATGGERSGGGSSGGAGKDAAPAGPALAGNRKEARRAASTVDELYTDVERIGRAADDKALIAGGGEDLCELMSERARRETIEYVRRSSGLKEKWDCPKAMGLLVGRSKRIGSFKHTTGAKVVGVNVKGRRATASIRFGKRGAVSTVPLVKEDGRWKLGARPVGDAR
jgi:hypothetical protein